MSKEKRAYTQRKYFILLERVHGICEVDLLAPDDNPLCVLHVSASSGTLVPNVNIATPFTLFSGVTHVHFHESEDKNYHQKH